MEALAEQAVALYLTRGGRTFIVPQYPVPSDSPGSDWSCPDFVALSYEGEKREVVVVEVKTGSDMSGLIKLVHDRKNQWFDRLWGKLMRDGIIDDSWGIRFLGFVRASNLDKVTKAFEGVTDVRFVAIEKVTFSWDYWTDRLGGPLPR